MAENEKLTDRFVKSAAAPDEGRPYRIYYDHEVKGFGLRVTKGGFRVRPQLSQPRRRAALHDRLVSRLEGVGGTRGSQTPQAVRRPGPRPDGRATRGARGADGQ